MDNIIEFPTKVFRQWGACAQALTTYLRCLGATISESKDIIEGLQVDWERMSLPLSLPSHFHSSFSVLHDSDYIHDVEIDSDISKNRKVIVPIKARTWFELAKLKYEYMKTS